ncbi:hypothetical protein L9F63_005421, partial [Diploptera punctata]
EKVPSLQVVCKVSVYNYIHRSKFNFFSTTFFRPSGDTPAIFRLPRCLYSMKCCVIYRINNFTVIFGYTSVYFYDKVSVNRSYCCLCHRKPPLSLPTSTEKQW